MTTLDDILALLPDNSAGDISAADMRTAFTDTFTDLAPKASPTFTGTVSGITKSMVGLANVDNTTDASKPVSTAQQTALDLKANIASPTFTGTVSGITKAMVGLGSVDNTADASKPVSTAQQTALDLKADLASPTFTGTVTVPRVINPVVVLTDASTIVINAALGEKFRVVLTGDHILGNPSNAIDGQMLLIELIQDGTGSQAVTLDTKYNDPNGYFTGQSTAAGKRDKLGVQYNSSADKFDVLAFSTGY